MLLLRHLKSYLPAHSILRGFVALHLCDFADAIRAGCAEAKLPPNSPPQSSDDAIHAGCAEAKVHVVACRLQSRDTIRAGCAEAKLTILSTLLFVRDAIRAGCSETNGRSLYSNDHAQNNEVNRKES